MCKRTARTILTMVVLVAASAPSFAEDAAGGPNPAWNAFHSANGMLNRGLYELAAAEYRKFLSDHGDHEKSVVARYGLGVCLFRMEQFDAAAAELAPLAKNDGFEFAAEVGMILGQCRLTLKDYDKAADALERVVRSHRDHSLADDAAAALVEALYLGGKYEDSVESSEDFTKRWSDNPLRERVEFFAGLSDVARKEFARAAVHFETLLERYPKGSFAAQSSLLLAQCYQQQGDAMEKAIKQYRAAIKNAGADAKPDALLGLAAVLRQKGDADEAARALDRFLEQHPQSPQATSARLQRARIHFEKEQFDKALALFDEAATQGGDLTDHGAYWAAKCLLRKGDFAEAARRYALATEQFPESPLAAEMLYDRAVALVRASQPADAIAALTHFRSRFPDHALTADAIQLLASAEHQQSHYRASDRYCAEFLAGFASHQQAPAVTFLSAENDFLDDRFEDAVKEYQSFLDRFTPDPQSPKAAFRLGTALYRLGRFDDAERHLSSVASAVKNDPLFRPALMALGDIAFQRGDWKQAERYLADYLASDENSPAADEALLKLGLARQRQERHAEALSAYAKLLDAYQDSPHRLQAMFERGQVLVAQEKFDDAAEAFEAVLREGDDTRFSPYALNHLAMISGHRRDFAKAAELLDRAASGDQDAEIAADALYQKAQMLMADRRYAEAETALSTFGKRYPKDARRAHADVQRAIALSRLDKHADAVAAIAAIHRAELEKLDDNVRSTVRYEMAWCLRQLGRPGEAAKAYGELIDSGAGCELRFHAMLELAGLESQEKRFSEAASTLRRLLEQLNSSGSTGNDQLREQTLYRLGTCEFELSRFREAGELFDRLVSDLPKSALAVHAAYQAGEAWFQAGRFENAVRSLTRVIETESDADLVAPALLRLGDCHASTQRWAASERAFGDHLARFEDSPVWFKARFGVAWARENQQRYAEAIAAYQDVVARHRGSTAARGQFQIGECLFAQEKYEDAARELLKVDILFAYPEWSAAALYEAGRCFEKLGKPAEARSQFSQVAEKYKDTRWAELASQRLSELSSAMSPPGHSP